MALVDIQYTYIWNTNHLKKINNMFSIFYSNMLVVPPKHKHCLCFCVKLVYVSRNISFFFLSISRKLGSLFIIIHYLCLYIIYIYISKYFYIPAYRDSKTMFRHTYKKQNIGILVEWL